MSAFDAAMARTLDTSGNVCTIVCAPSRIRPSNPFVPPLPLRDQHGFDVRIRRAIRYLLRNICQVLTASDAPTRPAPAASGLSALQRRRLTAAAIQMATSLDQLRRRRYSFQHKATAQTADALRRADRQYRARSA